MCQKAALSLCAALLGGIPHALADEVEVPYMYVTLASGQALDSLQLQQGDAWTGPLLRRQARTLTLGGRVYQADEIAGIRFKVCQETVADGIRSIAEQPATAADERIYLPSGQVVGRGEARLRTLGKGIYIYKGKKYVVR